MQTATVFVSALPELTEVGGRRGHTLDEHEHLMPSFGSGPFPNEAPGSGYYTREDYIEILRYAQARHIDKLLNEIGQYVDNHGDEEAQCKELESIRKRGTKRTRAMQEAAEYALLCGATNLPGQRRSKRTRADG